MDYASNASDTSPTTVGLTENQLMRFTYTVDDLGY